MKTSAWSLQDAKNKFSAVVDAALRGMPQMVTRRGQPAVVVIACEDYERLRCVDAERGPGFVEHLLALPRERQEPQHQAADLRPREIEV